MKLYSAQSSQAIDRNAIQNLGIPGILLMKRAGFFAFDVLQDTWPESKLIHVICGTGNNGGDGFIIAQYAYLAGFKVQVSLIGNEQKIHGDAAIALQELKQLGITPSRFSKTDIQQSDLIVDAIFGTGLNQPVSGEIAQIIEQINQAEKPVLAVDIPSGLDANTGQILGIAVHAQVTCSFITQKFGFYTFQGPEVCGKIHFSSLFIPKELYKSETPLAKNHPLKHWLNKLPLRLATHHKGVSGTVCLVGGNKTMMGAIQLAGLASLKTGAGLVKIITHTEHGIAITQAIPEVMCYPTEELLNQAGLANVIGIGPGLGLDSWGKELFSQAMDLPLDKVIDADALKHLAALTKEQEMPQNNWVLTPHPGEAAQLLETDTASIQKDRIGAIKKLQQKYGGVIVLKGNGTLIYDGNNMEICLAGNPGMAVGGMGDILTGTIATFIAQGLSLWNAACLGVSLHAHAGDVLANQSGQPGILPSEVAHVMSQLLSYSDSPTS
ncbi:bifunctional NAD(P)H-hydrate repair enzyme [Thiomicrorhabdus immobilis]|uniref:Bifunctional NAD(P)H-hydrate repair enzyme n=1 Tax=Thiomicrorhabdus immobilis TaxID=2791037 RepID=A0ABN6CYB4_9GAMM|nr:NAD(P)H-hydrate dehydratase [Thiomicrorhabdus immobilis]BCN94088.1 bifunctional NAD(P)H-hydrate repair enzyme [Thiomicrorhabdus immobilis]